MSQAVKGSTRVKVPLLCWCFGWKTSVFPGMSLPGVGISGRPKTPDFSILGDRRSVKMYFTPGDRSVKISHFASPITASFISGQVHCCLCTGSAMGTISSFRFLVVISAASTKGVLVLKYLLSGLNQNPRHFLMLHLESFSSWRDLELLCLMG